MGYSPRGHKEPDITSLSLSIISLKRKSVLSLPDSWMWIWNSASNLQTINNMPLGIWLSPYQPGYLESFSEQVLPKTHFYIKREINNSRELVKDKEAWLAAIHGITKSRTTLSDWTELNWWLLVTEEYKNAWWKLIENVEYDLKEVKNRGTMNKWRKWKMNHRMLDMNPTITRNCN